MGAQAKEEMQPFSKELTKAKAEERNTRVVSFLLPSNTLPHGQKSLDIKLGKQHLQRSAQSTGRM